jgi:hypothetical protein
MKHITKLLIISAGLMIVLAACGPTPAPDENKNVTDTAAMIADFEVPAGFTPELGAHLLGYSLASYKGAADPSHLYLIQSENKTDEAELQKMLEQMAPGASDRTTRTTVIENRPVTVRGQEATLVISEGTNHEGLLYRQAMVVFEGKGGPAMLLFIDTVENWDQVAVDALVQSIE